MMPSSIRVRMYQVGFGDCFLLTFNYASGSRHLLIDFGSVAKPKNSNGSLLDIARDIKATVGNDPFAVVATHRHADHISGFDPGANGKGPGAIIAGLKPRLVVQPWTEQLDLAEDAEQPNALKGLKARQQTLHGLQELAKHVVDVEIKQLGPSLGNSSTVQELGFIGEDNIANPRAVRNLATMGAAKEYLYARKKTKLQQFLPGTKVHVLGPPTVVQHRAVQNERGTDPDEFWNLKFRALGLDGSRPSGKSRPMFERCAQTTGGQAPAWARWAVKSLRRAHAEQTLQLVRSLDDAMNNTSLILLFECGDLKLLFPGDAQIENWEYALHQADLAGLLRDVTVYKVGHHGSTNATPKTLWNRWFPPGAKAPDKKSRMTALMSTMPTGKYPSVPRDKLVTALEQWTRLTTTNGLNDRYVDEVFSPSA